ncbi:MAG: hypothetical protein ACI4J4_06890 [Ruminiclostridium sp.]
MYNLIKALNYQTRRDNFLFYSVLAGCFSYILTIIVYSEHGDLSKLSGGEAVAAFGSSCAGLVFFVLVLTARICGWDYGDKTMNYELLSGHSRAAVFWSRSIVSLVWCIPVGFLIMVLPTAVLTLINGWGDNMDFGGAAIRFLLTIFPLFRLTCEFILLTFIVKNCYLSMVLGFILTEITQIAVLFITDMSKIEITYQLAISNLTALFEFNDKMGYVNGKDITVYQTGLEPEFILGTILFSLGVGIICLVIGSLLFKKRDI